MSVKNDPTRENDHFLPLKTQIWSVKKCCGLFVSAVVLHRTPTPHRPSHSIQKFAGACGPGRPDPGGAFAPANYSGPAPGGAFAPAKFGGPAPGGAFAPANFSGPAPGGAFAPANISGPAPGGALPGPTPGPG